MTSFVPLSLIAQSDEIPAGAAAMVAAMGLVFALVYLTMMVVIIASVWKVFTKAGKPGWAAIVPIYNLFVMLEVAGKPAWWFLLFLVPLVNLVMMIFVLPISIAEAFGKSAAFGLGLSFLGIIFWPWLAFGDAQYVGGGGGRPVPVRV